jgi:hypothetical protein
VILFFIQNKTGHLKIGKGKKMKFDKVFVHTAEMALIEGRYEFLPEDKHGFLHGEIRVEAIKILRKQEKVKEIIVVGGPTEDGASKAKLMADRIGGKVIPLESIRSTRGNIESIKNYLKGNNGRNGFLTNFYHIPRTLRLVAENGLDLIPICAEAVLLADNPCWINKIKEWYQHSSMLKRIVSEIQGLSFLEDGKYRDYVSEYG